jgi:glycosyltransferase involved in cell wall biosynthesis
LIGWLALLALPLAAAVMLVKGGLWTLLRLPRLPDVVDHLPDGVAWPALSVIAPCRDEAAAVERSARSLLAQDYPNLEVVFVDDRSTDGTGHILDAVATSEPRLTVVHVDTLPAGWLGKTHACQRAADVARGEWLLFTDGDVLFEPAALRRAIAFAEGHGLGHVVALPHMDAPGFLERAFVSSFGVAALLKFRPWSLHRAGTRAHAGVGAFNLVRADAYRKVGGHAPLAYEVVDDIKLGLVLRRSGIPQAAIDSGGLVHLRWNHGARATMRGLVKNAFAGAEYSWAVTLPAVILILCAAVAPWAALLLADSTLVRGVAGLTALLTLAVHVGAARVMARGSGLEALLHPLTQAALGLVLLWSAVVTTWRGGVLWRGTFYPLAELRARCVRDRDWPADRAAGWPR